MARRRGIRAVHSVALTAVVVGASWGLAAGPAAAFGFPFPHRHSVVDQSAVGPETGGYQAQASSAFASRAAQTFTAGRSGLLDEVTLKLENTQAPGEVDPPALAPLQVVITTVGSDGNPTDHIIGGGLIGTHIPQDDAGTVENIKLFLPALVIKNRHYAIVMETPSVSAPNGFWIAGATATPYTRGAMLVQYRNGTTIHPWQAANVAPGIDIESFYFQTWIR